MSEFRWELINDKCILEIINESDHDTRYGFLFSWDDLSI